MQNFVFLVWGEGEGVFGVFESYGVFSSEDAAIARFVEIADEIENHQDFYLYITAYPLDADPDDQCGFCSIAQLSNGKGWIQRLGTELENCSYV